MNKRSLGVLAVVLIALMAIVLMVNLDGLPRTTKEAVNTAVTQVWSDRAKFDEARTAVNRLLASDPSLYRTQASQWQAQLATSDARMKQAEAAAVKLQEMEKADKRKDRDVLESTAKQLTAPTAESVRIAQNLRAEAERWAGYKRDLPKQLAAMKASYEALHGYDVRGSATTARKAQTEWPVKKDDIEKRFTTLEALKQQGEEAWTASAADRAQAEAGKTADLDYSKLFAAGAAIQEDLKEVQSGTTTLNALASQLYVGRDKVLLELDDDNGLREKVRVVETKYADAALSSPQIGNREEWQNVDNGRFEQLKKSIGMVVERKPPGKYDNEADKVLQPPGYAYIAPPGQSNQYGSWNNGVWGWLPQYLLLSQMLRTSSYPQISTRDWNDYDRNRRSGTPWYGNNGEYGRTWSGGSSTNSGNRSWTDRARSWGSGTADKGGSTWTDSTRPRKDTWNTGGSTYDSSKYQSKGSYGGSRYQSRPSGGSSSGFGSRGYSSGRSFGGGGGRGGRR
ncbi:MAG: hypothetical protein SGI92_05785 [Bryobacteraceae bacterium]|nr:hypothetical protein [Bryobacteraceae bacterium]